MQFPHPLSLLPEEIAHEVRGGRAAIVGGAVRAHFERSLPRDVDVFFLNPTNYVTFVKKFDCTKKDDGIHTFTWQGMSIDLILDSGCESVEICVERADFDIAAGCYYKREFVLPDGFREAVKKRRMRLLNVQCPQVTYARFLRYKRYGYSCSVSDVCAILRAWHNQQR